MAANAPLVDGVLSVTHPSPDRLAFDYQSTRDDTVDPFTMVVLMTDIDIALPAEWTKK